MELKLYKTQDADNVLGKTLTDELLLNVRLRHDTDVRSPEITLSRSSTVDYRDYDMVLIPTLERYYFIRTVEKGAVIRLQLECDYLETYKNEILAAEGTFTRDTQAGDYGEMAVNETGEKEYTYYKSNVELEEDDGVLFSSIGTGGK